MQAQNTENPPMYYPPLNSTEQSVPTAPVMAQPVAFVTQTPLGPNPMNLTCPSCHAKILSKVESVPSTKTHIAALITFFLCCPLACVPYCVDSCQTQNHNCPNCGAFIGNYAQ